MKSRNFHGEFAKIFDLLFKICTGRKNAQKNIAKITKLSTSPQEISNAMRRLIIQNSIFDSARSRQVPQNRSPATYNFGLYCRFSAWYQDESTTVRSVFLELFIQAIFVYIGCNGNDLLFEIPIKISL